MLAMGTVYNAFVQAPRKWTKRWISDGNRDGNDGTHRRPRATVNSQLLSHVSPELGIHHT